LRSVGIKSTEARLVAGRFFPGDDRMLLHTEYLQCELSSGRIFTLDGACLPDGSNAHCNNYCSKDKPFEQAALQGHHVFLNGPFTDHLAVMLEHYCREKAADPYETSGCFVVPKWRGAPWQKYLSGMQVLKRYSKKSRIFRAIDARTGKRELMPGIPWEVLVYYDPPKVRPIPRVRLNMVVNDPMVIDSAVTVHPSVSMELKGTYAGASCSVLLDSGSRDVSFISEAFVARNNLRVGPCPDLYVVSFDGHDVRAKGVVNLKLKLESFVEPTRLFVVPMDGSVDIILGGDWLSSHHVVLDYSRARVTARNGRRWWTFDARRVPRSSWPGRTPVKASRLKTAIMTLNKAKRLLHKKAFAFVVNLKQTNPEKPAEAEFDIRELFKDDGLSCVSGQGLVPQSEVDRLIDEYKDVLREPPPGLPRKRNTVHTIPTEEGSKPTYRHPFRLSPAERLELEKQIKYLLEMGYVQPSTSPYGAPILFIPKPDGTLRMCVDYRMLNAITVKNRYSVPRTDDLIDTLGGSQVFSAIDLAAGYWQIRLGDEEMHKTAFSTHFGHFEWKVLPMGLTNAVATFQKLMNEIFGSRGYLGKFVLVYLDDILVYSKTPEDHLKHLRLVLQALRDEELFAKSSKCHFNKSELKYLGHIVGAEGIKVDPGKAAVVRDYPRPATVGEVRSFLGLATYFRRFIQGFGILARPLNRLTRAACTRAGFDWAEDCEASFLGLKEALTTAPCLAMPDWKAAESGTQPFELIADASVHGIGAVLLQGGRPIAYESRKFNSAAYNYDTGEQELLAIVYALQKFRCYVEGTDFRLVSDHEPLTYLDKQPRLSRKQARWYEFLRPFTYKWEHRPGRVNVADPLSRVPGVRQIAQTTVRAINVQQVSGHVFTPFCPVDIPGHSGAHFSTASSRKALSSSGSIPGAPAAYHSYLLCAVRPLRRSLRAKSGKRAAPSLAAPKSTLASKNVAVKSPQRSGRRVRFVVDGVDDEPSERLPPPPIESLVAAGYSLDTDFSDANVDTWGLTREGDLLWHGGNAGIDESDTNLALAIPNAHDLRRRCLELCHDSPFGGHFGVIKTLHLLRRSFWWPTMTTDVEAHIRSCIICQTTKPNNHAPFGQLSPLQVPDRRWQSVSMDFIVKLPVTTTGKDAILVVVDRLSKYVILIPCSETMKAEGLIQTLTERVVADRGFPEEIVADRDVRITASAFKGWADKHNIKLKLNTAYHSRANGQAERVNLTIENYLRAFVGTHMTDWDELIPVCQLTTNNSFHSTVENTPFYLEYGRHPYIPGLTTYKRAEVPPALLSAVRWQWPKHLREALTHARNAMKVASERTKRHFDKSRKPKEFAKGKQVLLNTRNLKLKGVPCVKLGPRFIGPYTIEEKVGNVSYRLALPECMKVHPVFHIELLREYNGPSFVPPPAIECEDGTIRYEIETILRERGHGARRQLLVRWQGFDSAWDTWEPRYILLEDAPDAVRTFDDWNANRSDARDTLAEPRATKSPRSRRSRRD
jgi:transposase InsO family protein